MPRGVGGGWQSRRDINLTTLPSRAEFNPLNAELNPICYLLALLGAHHFLHLSRIRVKSLTLRQLMSYIYIYIYIYGAPIRDVSRSHTTTHHSPTRGHGYLSVVSVVCCQVEISATS